jgi:hypothetical protein
MIVTTYRIPYQYGQTIKIKPLGDIHWGNRYCDKNTLKAFLEDSDDLTYFFGIGDLMDSIVVPDIRYSKHADDTESSTIIDEQVETLYDVLAPYKGRFVGLGRGNHEDVIIKKCGTDPVKRLCTLLDCTYLGYSGLVRLIFKENEGRGRTVVIRWHHGWGGGSRTQGADLTKYSNDVKHWQADIYLYGHVHRRQGDRIPRLGLVGEKLISRPKLIGICGTFLKTYSDSEDSTYSEVKGYPPVEVGGLTVNIKPTRKWVDMGFDI